MARLPCIFHAIASLWLFCLSNAYTKLSSGSLNAIPGPGGDFDIEKGKLLSPILQPRVPGTPGSTAVLNHFANFFETSLPTWKISFQNSTSKTPITGDKKIPFTNMIATRDSPRSNPGDVGYLTLVAHYDSLMKPEGFIGAIDSAAPCAMLMHVARSLEPVLAKKWASPGQGRAREDDLDLGLEDHMGLQIIFLDGEEAFDVWSDTDSIYGAKSLAAEMEATYHAALSTYHNALSSISLFLLLDLLGSKDPRVPSYFKTTHWAYQNMASLEARLRDVAKFKSSPNHRSKRTSLSQKRKEPQWFPESDKTLNRWIGGMVQDDHTPFMARGVEVLHIIPYPFPMQVWHQATDDGEHLDLDTVEDWAVLVTAFAAEWMDLEGNFEKEERSKSDPDHHNRITSKTEL